MANCANFPPCSIIRNSTFVIHNYVWGRSSVWQSAAMALQRSGVRPPSSPPNSLFVRHLFGCLFLYDYQVIELPKKAVILARGLGRRMRAEVAGATLTDEQQRVAEVGIKALIPFVDGKTLLEMIIANVAAAGFSEVCLVIGPEHGVIREFCLAKGLAVEFVVQNEARGTADAVLAAENAVGNELFLVVNSDNLYPVDGLRRLRDTNCSAMLAFEREGLIERSNITVERIASFATVEADGDGNLRRIVEKPNEVESGSFVSMNAWLFSPEIFGACRAIGPSPERGEYEITAAVQFAIDSMGIKFAAVKTNEGVLDLSNRADIESAGRMLTAGNQ